MIRETYNLGFLKLHKETKKQWCTWNICWWCQCWCYQQWLRFQVAKYAQSVPVCTASTQQRCLVTYCRARTLNTQNKWAVGRDESTFKVYVLFWVRFTLCVSNWTPECETSSTLIVYTHVHWTCTMYIVQRTCIHCIQSTWTYMCCSGVWDIPTEAIRLWQLLIFQK